MKQILHLLWDGHQGGVQRYVNKVCSSQDWQEYQHHILLFTEEGSVIHKYDSPVPVTAMKLNTNTQVRKCYNVLSQYIKNHNIELIHCHCDTLLFLSQIRLFSKCKLIYTEHGDSFVRNSRQALCRFLWRCNGKFWNKVIQNSYFTERVFVNQFPFLEEKTAVLCNPLLETRPLQNRSLNETLHIGSLGRLEEVKGNDLFLKSAALIAQKNDSCHFHIFGDGSQRQKLIQLSEDLDLVGKISFHGYTQNPLEAMSNLDCLVVPSRQESFGLVALEAMSVGTPVAAFEGTGISDFLINGENGQLATPGNCQELATAIEKIVESPDAWRKMSLFAANNALKNYSLKSHVEKLEEMYNETFICKQQKNIA